MYTITICNDGAPTIIHGERHKLASAKITRERNQICSLSFDIYPGSPGYDLLHPLSTTVEVIDTRTGTLAFEGRVVVPVPSMDESGLVMRTVTCEHVEAYLLDSMQAYVGERQWESPAEFIGYVLDVHNARMPEHKRVYVGAVDFQTYETSEGLWCGVQRESTWATLHGKLADAFGGEMRVRRDGGKLYLDYAEKLGTTRATPIKLGRNMRSSRREVNPNEVITRLYPYGAKKTVTQTDELGNEVEVETEERLTVASVNGGVDYIEDAAAVGEYGVIEGVHEWDDVTTPNVLLAKARAWLGDNNKMPVTTTITALDLSLLGMDPDDFALLDRYPCENPLIGLDDVLEIVRQTVDVCNPMDSTFDMGQTAQTTSKQMASISAVSKVVESVKSQQQTAIVNLQNSARATNASIKVLDAGIVSRVEETVTTVVSELDVKDGQDAVTLRIDSSRGTVFKNSEVSTVLSAVVYKGGACITDADALREELGSSARLEWSWQRMGEDRFGVISSADTRISQGGFALTVSPDDVDVKTVFTCSLVTE